MDFVPDKPFDPPPIPTARCIATPAPACPLSEEDFRLLRRAAASREPVRKVAATARFSAVTTLVIGVAGIPFLFFSPSSIALLMVIGICTIGVIEFVGYRRIRRGMPSAATWLGRNQLAFMALIVGYCIFQMATVARKPLAAFNSPELQSSLSQLDQGLSQQIEHWTPIVGYGFYGLVLVLSVLFQGGLALYYFSRRRHLETLETSTPAWVRRVFAELDA
jgi:hypothetical protein